MFRLGRNSRNRFPSRRTWRPGPNFFLVELLLLGLFLALPGLEAHSASVTTATSPRSVAAVEADSPPPPTPETRTAPLPANPHLPSLNLQIGTTPTELAVGETATVNFTITNGADDPADALVVTLPTPAGAEAVDETGVTPGGFVSTGEGWRWLTTRLDPKSSLTFVAHFRVTSVPPGEALLVNGSATARGLTQTLQEVGGAIVLPASLLGIGNATGRDGRAGTGQNGSNSPSSSSSASSSAPIPTITPALNRAGAVTTAPPSTTTVPATTPPGTGTPSGTATPTTGPTATPTVPVNPPPTHTVPNTSTLFQPGQTATLKSADGRVEVTFPAGAYSKELKLEHKPLANKLTELLPGASLPTAGVRGRVGFGTFYLEAHETGPAGGGSPVQGQGQEVHQFAAPVTLKLSYTPQQLRALGLSQDNLSLFWWDEDAYEEVPGFDGVLVKAPQKGRWVAVPTTIDPAAGKVTATLDHFSPYQLSDGSSPSERYLPTVQGWQVSGYTGAASYSYPIEVPPGPGGVKPAVDLAYSSAATDGKSGLRQHQQAGWVGKGWSLDVPSISLNKAEAGNYYSLSLGGASFDLFDGFPIGGTNPQQWEYRASNQSFARIRKIENGLSYDANGSDPGRGGHRSSTYYKRHKWQVWTKDGTYYEFAEDAWQDWLACPSDAYLEAYKWGLSFSRDTHGNVVTYNYGRATQALTPANTCSDLYGTADYDLWPTSITWGGTGTPASDRFKVEFDTSGARTVDLNYELLANQRAEIRQTRQLQAIYVKSRQASTWDLIHQYWLSYDTSTLTDALTNTSGSYKPDFTFPRLTLSSIRRYGSDASTYLPDTVFTYGTLASTYSQANDFPPGNFNRLIKMDNGQGGDVTLAYENIGAVASGPAGFKSFLKNYRRVTSRTETTQAQSAVGLPAASYTTSYSYGTPSINSLGTTLQPSAAVPQSYPNSAALYLNNQQNTDPSVQSLNRQILAHPMYNEFRGHEWMQETAPAGQKIKHYFLQGEGYDTATGALNRCNPSPGTSFGDVPLNWTRYYNDTCWLPLRNGELLKGKEYKTETYDALGTLVGQTDHRFQTVFDDAGKTDYGNTPISGLWSAFTYETETRTTTWDSFRSLSVSLRTVTSYSAPGYQQGGTFYGNPTRTEQYDQGGNLYLRTETFFNTQDVAGGAYIVDRPWMTRVTDKDGKVLSLSHTFYDGNTTAPAIGTKGEATRSLSYYDIPLQADLNGVLLHGPDGTVGYNSFGNPTTTRSYAGAGTAQYNSSTGVWTFSAPGGGSAARLTTTAYDPTFNLYPTSTTMPTVGAAPGMVTSAAYDYRMGLLTGVTDANNVTTTNEYDVFGRVVKQLKPGTSSAYPSTQAYYYDWEKPFRYLVTYRPLANSANYKGVQTFYDGLGRPIQSKTQSQAGAQNSVVNSEFDLYGRAYRTSQPRFLNETPATTFWKYDAPVADPNVMRWTKTDYDELGRTRRTTAPAPDNSKTEHYYGLVVDPALGKTLAYHDVTDANQHRTQQRTDEWGHLRTVYEVSGNCGNIQLGVDFACTGSTTTPWAVYSTTRYAYDLLGRMINLNDTKGSNTYLSYDSLGRKTAMSDPDMGYWYYAYDANGQLVQQLDHKLQLFSFNYDELGRLRQKNILRGQLETPVLNFSDPFDAASPPNWVYSGGGEQTVPYNDGGNNVLKNTGTGVTGGAWNASLYRNSYSLNDGKSVSVRFKPDATTSDGMIGVESNGPTQQRFALRIQGSTGTFQVQSSTDGVSFPTVDPSSGPFPFAANTWYNLKIGVNDNGMTLEVWAENQPQTRGTYRLTMATGQSWRLHAWQKSGYTLLDNLKEETSFGAMPAATAYYNYDEGGAGAFALGRLTSASNSNLKTTNTYDNRGRVTKTSYSNIPGLTGSRSFAWTYDSGDRISTFQMPSLSTPGEALPTGETLTYTYNDLWQATALATTKAGVSSGSYISGASYNALGQPVQRTIASTGVTQRWTYAGALQRLDRMQAGKTTAGDLLDRSYTYDAVGNIKSIGDNKNSTLNQSFGYDERDRLTSATFPNTGSPYPNETYAYDEIGNITSKAGTPYTYPAAGKTRPHTPLLVGSSPYVYDYNGNITSGGGRTLTWDTDNKPLSVTGTDGITEYYAYGPNGERVKRTRGSVTTVYLGSWEEDLNSVGGSLLERRIEYKFGGSVFLSWSSDPTKGNTYLHADHLGSVSVTSSDTGALVSQQTFDPWGKVRSGGGIITQTTDNYTGQKLDGTGLLFYNARYYDPSLGKFLSADTVGASKGGSQGLNLYTYVNNNPLNRTDPSGHCTKGNADYDDCMKKANDVYWNNNYWGEKSALEGLELYQLGDLEKWLNRGIAIRGNGWTAKALDMVRQSVDRVYNYLAGIAAAGTSEDRVVLAMRAMLGISTGATLNFEMRATLPDKTGTNTYGAVTNPGDPAVRNTVLLGQNYFDDKNNGPEYLIALVVHEMGHLIDWHRNGSTPDGSNWVEGHPFPGWYKSGSTWSYRGKEDNLPSVYASNSPQEDFAETFTWLVSVEERRSLVGISYIHHTSGNRTKNPGDERIGYVNTVLGAWLPLK